MANEKGRNKQKREQKKTDRLRRLLGVDLCACGGGDKLKCHGICQEAHRNQDTGRVECGEKYQVECSGTKKSGSRRPKRDWKFGKQKKVDDNQQDKQHRREKRERDNVE